MLRLTKQQRGTLADAVAVLALADVEGGVNPTERSQQWYAQVLAWLIDESGLSCQEADRSMERLMRMRSGSARNYRRYINKVMDAVEHLVSTHCEVSRYAEELKIRIEKRNSLNA